MVISNELIFILHVLTVAGFTLGSLAMGRTALTATICLYGILSNLFVTKQITLFGFSVVSTDVFAVGGILGLNLIQEYFGMEATKRAIVLNAGLLLFYLTTSLFLLWYTPNQFDVMHNHFACVLMHTPRIVIASMLVYLLVQFIDAHMYRFFKTMFNDKYLVSRNMASLMISQFLDTLLFSFAALYGIVHSVGNIIVISYAIKILVIIGTVPFVKISRLIIKPND
jgi:uncharacterized integral membrane protein (TIGR00697 family)